MMNRYQERGGLVSQGISAELIADQWNLTREQLDEFSARSQEFAARATEEGRFEREILPLAVKDDEGKVTDEIITTDEGIRPGHDRRGPGEPEARFQGRRQGHRR